MIQKPVGDCATTDESTWTRVLARDVFPGRTTPFGWSLLRMPVENAMRGAWTALGVGVLPEGPFWACDAAGTVRLNLSAVAEASKALQGSAWLGSARADAATGLAARLRLAGIRRRVEAEVDAARAAAAAQHARLSEWQHWVSERKWTQADLLQVMEELEPNALAALQTYFTLRIGLETTMSAGGGVAVESIAGIEGLPSVEAVDALAVLATHGASGSLRDLFLATYGHRGPRDVTPAAMRWHEQPEKLSRAVALGRTPRGQPRHTLSAAEEDLIRAADTAWDSLALVMAAAQRWLGAVAHEAAGFELITNPADGLLLELEELKRVATGEWHGGHRAAVQEQVERRRNRLHAPAGLPDETSRLPANAMPAGGGATRGPALCVMPVDDAPSQQGAILVTEHPDAGWTDHWLTATGLVSASADLWCPGLLVARALGMPLVIGASEFVSHAMTGMHIDVDGDTGRIIALA